MTVSFMKLRSKMYYPQTLRYETDKNTYLSLEEEKRLGVLVRDHNDENARQRLIKAHMSLAGKQARKFTNNLSMVDELISEGLLGIVKATNTFDPDRGARFSTHCTYWIRAYIYDYIVSNWSVVRIAPTGVRKTLFFKLRSARAAMFPRANHRLLNITEIEEISKVLNAPPRIIQEMDVRLIADSSLNVPINMDGGSVGEVIDLLKDDNVPFETDHERRDLVKSRYDAIKDGFKHLSPMEKKVFAERYLYEGDQVSMPQLAIRFSVSRQRIEQLEKSAIKKLKTFVDSNYESLLA